MDNFPNDIFMNNSVESGFSMFLITNDEKKYSIHISEYYEWTDTFAFL